MYAIAIDGPAGAGKSSVAKAAAKALGFVYVDTGALYRTVGLYLLRSEVDPADAEAVEPKLRDIQVDLKYEDGVQHVILNGEDVSGLIRTPEVSMAASACASVPAVRKFLFSAQVDMKKLSDEYDELEQAHETTYGEFKAVRDDLHRLWKVKSCVDTAARFNERTEEQKLQNRPQTRQKKEDMTR